LTLASWRPWSRAPTAPTRRYLGQHLELAAREDRESVQIPLPLVTNALATRNLEIKRATARWRWWRRGWK
jgi:hypothetical protein